MKSLFQKFLAKSGSSTPVAFSLGSAVRFPHGTFKFKLQVAKGSYYEIETTTNLKNWQSIFQGTAAEETEFLDTQASKNSYRFYPP